MPKVTPLARSGYVLDPKLKIDKTDTLESDQKKEKMLPQEQREIAALRPKSSFKELPTGWTREKVARACNDAPLKGIPKSLFLEKWAGKYDFPLGQQKAATWVRKYINDEDSNIDSEESFIESD